MWKVVLSLIFVLLGLGSCRSELGDRRADPSLSSSAPLLQESQFQTPFVCPKKNLQPLCYEFPECSRLCAELFFRDEDRKIECHNWPALILDPFLELIEIMESGVFQDMDLNALDCFFKFVKNDSPVLFKRFKEEDALDFLKAVAEDRNLSRHLSSADSSGNFPIMRSLFRKVNSNRIKAIQSPLDAEGNSFLILSHEMDNRHALVWLDSFISHWCRREGWCSDPLEYYCKIFKKTSSEHLSSFFSDNDFFEREYEEDISNGTCGTSSCEYGSPSDFREFCRSF